MDGLQELFTLYPSVEWEMPFAVYKRASIGLGGYADCASYPRTETEFTGIVQEAERRKIPYVIVGNMTNVLPPDGRLNKLLILTEKLDGIFRTDETSGVYAQAGVTGKVFLSYCENAGKTGAEFLEGIPCSIGGAVYMNAGACGKRISDVVESVTVFLDGKKRILTKEDCRFSYKDSLFMHEKSAILGVTFRLENAEKETVRAKRAEYAETRKRLPEGKSMGCVFKNPKDTSAGKLIESVSMKGARVGGAFVSDAHANFIINDGTGTTEDVLTLIRLLKNAVYAKHGVMLEEEIRYL